MYRKSLGLKSCPCVITAFWMEATNQNIYLIHLIANEIHILRQRLILIRTQGLSIRIIGHRMMTGAGAGAVAGFEAVRLRASEEDAAK